MKEESEKVGLKLNIQKKKIMASGPITLWEIDGETVADFILEGSKITADGDCSHEIKRNLILGSGRSLGGGNDNPLQCSYLEKPVDRGAWWVTVHGVAKRQTRLSNFTFCHFPILSKAEHGAHTI